MFPRPDKEPVGPVVECATEVLGGIRTIAGDVGRIATTEIGSAFEAVERGKVQAVRWVSRTRVSVRGLLQELEDPDQHDV